MKADPLTKVEIAVAQLQLAVSLFLTHREYIAVVTLAGVAEEILGKLVAKAGLIPSLTRHTANARGMYIRMWKSDPGTKPFADLRNKTKNELKHLVLGKPIIVDIKAEAMRMLDGAVENYRLLHPRVASFVRQYERRRAELRRQQR
jgi:hypothetical protein